MCNLLDGGDDFGAGLPVRGGFEAADVGGKVEAAPGAVLGRRVDGVARFAEVVEPGAEEEVLEGGEDAPKTVIFRGQYLRYLNPDERSTASLIRNALLKKVGEDEEVRASPGVSVTRMSFPDVLEQLSTKGSFVYLKEDGEDCRSFEFPEDPIFILGDNQDLTEEEEVAFMAYSPKKICLGPKSLHADHCMIIVQNELDRRSGC